MERYTYEITFTRLDGKPDEVQQYTTEAVAKEALGCSMSRTAQSFTAASS